MPGLTQINLSVNSANAAALALYEGLGFSSFGLERGYLQVDGVLHDEIHMARPLP
jgi:RimJ/RimL family protein N-acetyltransferase